MSFQFPFCFESCCYLIYIYVCILYSLKFVVADNIESDTAYCCFFCLFVRSLLWNVLLTFNDELIIRKTKQILIVVIFPTSSTIPTGLLCILCIFTYRSLRKKTTKNLPPGWVKSVGIRSKRSRSRLPVSKGRQTFSALDRCHQHFPKRGFKINFLKSKILMVQTFMVWYDIYIYIWCDTVDGSEIR